jgi:hypothetical protein
VSNPNQYSTAITSLISKTEIGVLTTAQVVILSTSAVGALTTVTNLMVTNLSTAQVCNLTVQEWPAITMTGTPRNITSALAIPPNDTLVIIDKTNPVHVGEAQCLSAAGSAASLLEYIISSDVVS